MYAIILGRAYGRISDFSFDGRTENGHEVAFELVSWADFKCLLHHFSSLAQLKRSWGRGGIISQFKSFGSLWKHAEIGSESFGVVVCRLLGTVPCILGLV